MSTHRPTGITVVGALMVLNALWGMFNYGLAGVVGLVTIGSTEELGLVLFVVGSVLFAVSAGKLFVAWGLLRMASWGWTWTVVFTGFAVALNGIALVLGSVAAGVAVVVNAVVFGYVYSQKRHFRSDRDRTVPRANRT